MSNFETWTPTVQGVPGTAPRIFSASTEDNITQLTALGYLNDLIAKGHMVKDGDIFYINYSDTSDYPDTQVALHGWFTVQQVGANYSFVNGGQANALTAFAGGGQASATLLPAAINRVTTVATAADSVKLPLARPGRQITVINASANSMNVFPQTGEFINGLAVNTAIALAGGATGIFTSAVTGTWNSLI